jgi:hypothetical protein
VQPCVQILTFREECRVAEPASASAAAPPAPATPAVEPEVVLEEGEMTDAAPRKWDVFAFPHHILEPANGFRYGSMRVLMCCAVTSSFVASVM